MNRLLPGKRAPWLQSGAAVVVLSVAWPVLHFLLVQLLELNPWGFAGWAMYATPPPAVDVHLLVSDGSSRNLVALPMDEPRLAAERERFVRRRKQIGVLASPAALADLAMQQRPDAKVVTVEVTRRHLHGRTGRIASAATTYRFERPRTQPVAELARAACGSCHLLPAPSLLPVAAWKEVLPTMGLLLGFSEQPGCYPEGIAPDRFARRRARFLAAGLLPTEPALDPQRFAELCEYFVAQAPAAVAAPAPPSRTALQIFAQRALPPAEGEAGSARHTLVRIDPRGQLLVGDARGPVLREYDRRLSLVRTRSLGGVPVHGVRVRNGWLLSEIGRELAPNDLSEGMLEYLGDGGDTARSIARSLARPVFIDVGALDGDEDLDVVIPQYGQWKGRFTLLLNAFGPTPRQQLLAESPGSLQALVTDLNQDGRPDIVTLSAQQTEEIVCHCSGRDGRWEPISLYRGHPALGFTGFLLQDLTGDGRPDLVAWNGDAGDLQSAPAKPYQGIRLIEHQEGLRFVERSFIQLPGVAAVRAADFDRDGHIDLAAVSLWPGPAGPGFLYLAGAGQAFDFEPRTLDGTLDGSRAEPWFTLDAGDLDGDGDVDLALGGNRVLVLDNLSARP